MPSLPTSGPPTPERFRDISFGFAQPWTDEGRGAPGTTAAQLREAEGIQGQDHPNLADLGWRRYLDEELEGLAIYAGFSNEREVVAVVLVSLDGKTPLNARHLAKVSVDGLRRRGRQAEAKSAEGMAWLHANVSTAPESVRAEARERWLAKAAQLQKRPGRAGHPDSYYATVAVRYAELVTLTDAPSLVLAEELFMSEASARNLVYEARKRGFLTPAMPGRSGGTATPKALAALEENGEN